MKKTTVYLPDDLLLVLTRRAQSRGKSLSAALREAIETGMARRRPRAGLFASKELVASRADELLEGFGGS